MSLIEKPWGSEELLEHNERYVLKRLVMKEGHRCSLQYHEKKQETIYVLSGKLRILYGEDKDHLRDRVFQANEVITIPTGMVHRMEGVEDSVYLEASTPELDDVIRISDDYQRA
jgi:mannose-6-phosphate isomerase-like protein (cupin superfamily)